MQSLTQRGTSLVTGRLSDPGFTQLPSDAPAGQGNPGGVDYKDPDHLKIMPDSLPGKGIKEAVTDLTVKSDMQEPSCSKHVRKHFPDEANENHYVLVIHGTFDAPSKGNTPWYWRGDESTNNFCSILAEHLKGTTIGEDAIWRPLPGERKSLKLPEKIPYPFHWEGSNTHGGRVSAGKEVARIINAIGQGDPAARVHLVAHSHGGNVALQGISKYLSLLRKQAGKTSSRHINDEFWATHYEAHRDIKTHQRVYNLSLLHALLGPFLVVRRPWLREEDGGDYLWGYWAMTDWLLGLGRHRQRSYLRRKWSTSPAANALGRIVFMGTPFYTKCWEPLAWLYMLFSSVFLSLVAFLAILGGAVLVHVAASHHLGSADPRTYPAGEWAGIAVAAIAVVGVNTARNKRYRDGNLYYNEERPWSPSMKALVLNAGKLDEAALALSTEPIVRAYLMPALKAMLTPDPWKKMRVVPWGGSTSACLAACYANLWLTFWNVVLAVPFLLLRGLSILLVPILSNMLLRLFINLGFGLQKGELDYARVFVDEHLRLALEVPRILHWNVQKLLTTAGQTSDDTAELGYGGGEKLGYKEDEKAAEEKDKTRGHNFVVQRWRFLWDNAELDKKAMRSITMKRLRKQIHQMPFNPKSTRFAFERELKLICVTLEERYKDMTGHVELSHGSYFRNRHVIAAAAFFLANGEMPYWAADLGDLQSLPETGGEELIAKVTSVEAPVGLEGSTKEV